MENSHKNCHGIPGSRTDWCRDFWLLTLVTIMTVVLLLTVGYFSIGFYVIVDIVVQIHYWMYWWPLGLSDEHPVYFHCFNQGMDIFSIWFQTFKYVIFRISPVVLDLEYHLELPRVIHNLIWGKLLLEMDAPYLGPSSALGKGLLPPKSTGWLSRLLPGGMSLQWLSSSWPIQPLCAFTAYMGLLSLAL